MGTLTTNLGLDKPTVGADADQWGTLLNQSLDTLDLSVQFGALTKSVAGGVNVTLTANEAAKNIIILTGALTANIAVIVPNSPARRYVFRNNTTGAFTVTVRRAVGTGVVVPQGTSRILHNDGTEVFFEDVQNALNAMNATNATNANNATTATNVNGGTANVTTLTASGNAALNANVTLGDAGADITTINSQVSLNGSVGTTGQIPVSRGANLSLEWQNDQRIGLNQSWQNLTASRAVGTTYTNNTGRPINVVFTGGANANYIFTVQGVTVAQWTQNNSQATVSVIVPNGQTYSVTNGSVGLWAELR